MSSDSGGFVPRPPQWLCPWTPLGTSVLQTPSLPTPGKILQTPVIGLAMIFTAGVYTRRYDAIWRYGVF